MKKIINVFAIALFCLVQSCSKEEQNNNSNNNSNNSAQITTDAVTNIGTSSFACGGTIKNKIVGIWDFGIVWSTSHNPTINSSKKSGNHDITHIIFDGIGTYSCVGGDDYPDLNNDIRNYNGLTSNTLYYVRAYVTTGDQTYYGNEISFTTLDTPYKLGSSHFGGKVCYILQPTDPQFVIGETHGFVASINMYEGKWSPTSNLWEGGGSTQQSFGSGPQNTYTIANSLSNNNYNFSAARICYNSVSGGYNDWYLPSLYEIIKIKPNMNLIYLNSSVHYWTSSDISVERAWTSNSLPLGGGQPGLPKLQYMKYFAIRNF